MRQEDFTDERFKLDVIIKADKEKAFDYFATPKGLTKWFIGEAVFEAENRNKRNDTERAREGDYYKWKWQKEFEGEGKILEIEELKKIRFTFGTNFEVFVTFETAGDRTRISLVQKNIEIPENYEFSYINCCVCWGFFLTNLKSVEEFGNDLRETHIWDESLVNQ